MKTFMLEILASDKTFYEGEAENIILPTLDGKVGILANHAPTVYAITIGELDFKTDEGWSKAVVSSGVAQILDNKVTILVDTIERPEEIDAMRAEEARIRAEERLRRKDSQMEYYQSKAALARAMSRLKITKKN